LDKVSRADERGEKNKRRTNWGCIIAAIIIAVLLVALILGFLGCVGSSLGLWSEEEVFPKKEWSEKIVAGRGEDKFVLIRIEGEISENKNSNRLTSNSMVDDIVSELEQAKNDEKVKAIILKINSPGGTVTGSDILFEKIKSVRKGGKPVIALFSDTAASGAYYLASAADKIVSNPASITGSIGVIIQFPDFSGILSNYKIKFNTIKSGRLKDIGDTSKRMTAEERKILQTLVDNSYELFLERVSQGRGIAVDRLRQIADGRPLDGRQAYKLKLVDELGNLPKAIEISKELAQVSEATLVEYQSSLSWQQLLSTLKTKIFAPTDLVSILNQSSQPVLKYLYTY